MKIAIDAALCLKKKYSKSRCTACIDVCPTQSIADNLDVNNTCINCGLCLAKCPVEAIAGNDYGLEPLQQLISKEAPIRLSCRKCQPDSVWPCLGFFDPILLLTLVYSGKNTSREVSIYHQECSSCNSDVAQHIARIIDETNRLLGADKTPLKTTSEKRSFVALQAISRRQFFAELWGASVSTVREVAFPISDRLDPIPRRDLFLEYKGAELTPRYIEEQTTFKSMAIHNSCNACGLCEKICTKQAVTNVLEDGILEVWHNPVLCNNCDACATQCPQDAIEFISAHAMDKSLITRVSLPVCSNCGDWYQPIGDSSSCLDCMQKAKILSL